MSDCPDPDSQPVSFEWDEGNVDKNWEKHGVRATECEEIFFNWPLLVQDDPRHSRSEARCYALGQTHAGRQLFVVFTHRGDRIRVISARDMSRRERRSHARAQEDS